MKGDSVDRRRHEEWQLLLKKNPIYLGDHMTRNWEKCDSQSCQIGDRKSSLKSQHAAENLEKITPSSRCSKRKLAPGKRKLKAGKNQVSRHNVTKKDVLEWKNSFDSLLNSPTGCYLFKVFLESEVADENLKFWLACEDLKNSKQKQVEKRIKDIYDTYINVYSPHEINIDYKMREEIINQIKCRGDADITVFSEAQHQVYTLMHRDSYPRFLSSPMATKLIDALIGEEEETKINKKSREDSMSVSGLVTCCYFRRWDSDQAINGEDESTAVTQVGASEYPDERLKYKNSENFVDANRNREALHTSGKNDGVFLPHDKPVSSSDCPITCR